MFSFLTPKGPTTAHINSQRITVSPRETLLQAALRQGIEFPHSCRVGGCATCKCKLVEGKVKELTESGYILSAEELSQGYILACQSVPRTDIRVEVDLSPAAGGNKVRSVTGRVIGQEKLTRDITRLRVQLDEILAYKAGQYADISIAALPGIRRSYSFTTPMQPDAQISFFVREVPGGVFSSLINSDSVIGQSVVVQGPFGEFWLRPANAPILLVAGGSGLAPILAILREAIAAGVSRSATLLFGAREEKDLYALEEIRAIARQWNGTFHFIPVLSSAAADADWTGERGLVTEKIASVLAPESHAYLCGPPAMVDIAVAVLKLRGICSEHIYADRFLTRQDVAPAVA